MKRLLEVLPFYSLDKALEYLEDDGELLPLHHVWCYDQFKKAGYEVHFIPNNPSGFLGRLGRLININNLQQQLTILRRAKDFDVIFDPFMQFTFLIAIFKIFGVFNLPVIAISQRAYVLNKKNPLKRLRQYLVRYVYFKGLDKIIFINKTLSEKSTNYRIQGESDYLRHWGVDHDYFEGFDQKQELPAKLDYIYSTGGAARDYNTLLKAFENIHFDLRITAKPNFAHNLNTKIPSNVCVDSSIIPGLTSTGRLRHEYYNCLAVALPLDEGFWFAPFGSTVLFEAMAAGKAIIVTKSKAYSLDVEKEGIGLLVEYHDVKGWEKAVNYLIDNPEIAKEMGRKAQKLSREVFNYIAYSNEIIAHTNNLLEKTINSEIKK